MVAETQMEKDFMELCDKLHNLMDDIPENVKNKIWDDVYKWYEP